MPGIDGIRTDESAKGLYPIYTEVGYSEHRGIGPDFTQQFELNPTSPLGLRLIRTPQLTVVVL